MYVGSRGRGPAQGRGMHTQGAVCIHRGRCAFLKAQRGLETINMEMMDMSMVAICMPCRRLGTRKQSSRHTNAEGGDGVWLMNTIGCPLEVDAEPQHVIGHAACHAVARSAAASGRAGASTAGHTCCLHLMREGQGASVEAGGLADAQKLP